MGFLTALLLLPGLVTGLTLHEFAHAWSASLLGDDFPRRQGRVSLNPLRHLAPLGTLAIFFLPFGWARPVQVNLYNFKHPKRDFLLSSLAGPLANLVVVGVCFLLMLHTRHCYAYGELIEPFMSLGHLLLMMVALINVMLATINLLPIPPLDGSKIWPFIIPGLKPSFGRKTTMLFVALLLLLLWSGSLDSIVGGALKTVMGVMPASDETVFRRHYDLGQEASDRGDYAEAEKHFSAAVALNPGSHEGLLGRAAARTHLGNLDGAVADMDGAIRLFRWSPAYYEYRAVLHSCLDRHDEAVADYEAAELLWGDRAAGRDLRAARRANRGALDKLNRRLPKIEFSNIPVSDAFQFIRDVAELDVEVDWRGLELSRDAPVVAAAEDVTVREALRAILDSAGGGRQIRYGVVDGKVVIPARAGPAPGAAPALAPAAGGDKMPLPAGS